MALALWSFIGLISIVIFVHITSFVFGILNDRFYSIFHIIHNHSAAAFSPILIDSPNQQAQDATSLRKMIEFIRDNRPTDSQLILGLEDMRGIEFKGKLIHLKNKYSLLLKDEFSSVAEEVDSYLDKCFSEDEK